MIQEGKAFALHKVNLVSISAIPYGPPTTIRAVNCQELFLRAEPGETPETH